MASNDQDYMVWTMQVAANTAATADIEYKCLKQEAANKVELEKELEKKRPKLLPLNLRGMPSLLLVNAPLYAFHKLELIEYIKLYYFNPEICCKGFDTYKSTSNNTFTLVYFKKGLTLCTTSSAHPFHKVILDLELSWEQFSLACTVFITKMQ